MYKNGEELLAAAAEKGSLWEAVIAGEEEYSGASREEIFERTRKNLAVMRGSATKALHRPIDTVGGMITGDSERMMKRSESGKSLCGSVMSYAMAMALSGSEVNASMGRICAAPTAGACGIIPAALFAAEKALGSSEEDLLKALITSAGIGGIITRNATVAGAEGGCQAECGSAAAMAAAAVVQLMGGSPEQALTAAAIALKNVMGLVCDPIAGIVEAPCAKRNASGVVNAIASAEMAMAGIRSVIPFDEVVDAMYRVGRMLPTALRETAMGGTAATPTGKAIHKRIFDGK